MTTYRGCTIERTNTTTDVRRVVFGQPYQAIGYIWRVSGRLSSERPGLGQQWLTSAAECRAWIRGQDAEEEDLSAEEEHTERTSARIIVTDELRRRWQALQEVR